MAIALYILAAGFVFNAVDISMRAQNIVQQILGAMHFVPGAILLAGGMIVQSIQRIQKKGCN